MASTSRASSAAGGSNEKRRHYQSRQLPADTGRATQAGHRVSASTRLGSERAELLTRPGRPVSCDTAESRGLIHKHGVWTMTGADCGMLKVMRAQTHPSAVVSNWPITGSRGRLTTALSMTVAPSAGLCASRVTG